MMDDQRIDRLLDLISLPASWCNGITRRWARALLVVPVAVASLAMVVIVIVPLAAYVMLAPVIEFITRVHPHGR